MKAPTTMQRGAAVAHSNNVYCVSKDCNIYRYQFDTHKWHVYPQCPHHNPGLAIIGNLLTAVGGTKVHRISAKRFYKKNEEHRKTCELVSWKSGKWVGTFSPMNYARYGHAVISDDRCVIVAGGHEERSVEIYSIGTNTWSTLKGLPRVLLSITATLCDDHIYVMERTGNMYVYRNVLHSVLSSSARNELEEQSSPNEWMPLPRAPAVASTLSTMCGQVLAVGGRLGNGYTAIRDIYQLCERKWVKIGRMDTARFDPIVAVLPGNRMIVVGGTDPLHDFIFSKLDAVEVAIPC